METEVIVKSKGIENSLSSILIMKNNDRINYFESDGIITYIVLEDGSRIKVEMFLHQLEKVVSTKLFYRCGWSFLINLTKIQEFWNLEYPFIVMENGEVIPVPQAEKEYFEKLVSKRIVMRNA